MKLQKSLTWFIAAVLILAAAVLPLAAQPSTAERLKPAPKAALQIGDLSFDTDAPFNNYLALSGDSKSAMLAWSKCLSANKDHEVLWKKVAIWDLDQKKEIRALRGHTDAPRLVAMSEDGKKAVAVCETYGVFLKQPVADTRHFKVVIWDATTGELKMRFEIEGYSIAISQNGARVLGCSSLLKEYAVYEFGQHCKKISSFKVEKGISRAQFSPDASLLATIDEQCVIRVFEVASGKEQARFRLEDWALPKEGQEEREAVLMLVSARCSLFFSRDNKQICVSSARGFHFTHCWSVPTKKLVQSFKYGFLGKTFTADGRFVLGTSGDGQSPEISLVSLKTGKRVAELTLGVPKTIGNDPPISGWTPVPKWNPETFLVASDGVFVLIGGREEKIRIWDLPKELPE